MNLRKDHYSTVPRAAHRVGADGDKRTRRRFAHPSRLAAGGRRSEPGKTSEQNRQGYSLSSGVPGAVRETPIGRRGEPGLTGDGSKSLDDAASLLLSSRSGREGASVENAPEEKNTNYRPIVPKVTRLSSPVPRSAGTGRPREEAVARPRSEIPLSGGSLGSRVDEGRSQLRELM